MDIYHSILLLVFKYVRRNQCSVYGIFFLMLFIQSQLFSLLNMFNKAEYV